jgi:hypothetical protein
MDRAGLLVARSETMTRSFGSYRKSIRRVTRSVRRPRNPSIQPMGFKCFRLVAIRDPEPTEGPFERVELCETMNAMGAFLAR